MDSLETTKNWVSDTSPEVLNGIHERDVNIAIYDRKLDPLKKELEKLTKRDFEFRANGSIDSILSEINLAKDLIDCTLIKKDIADLLKLFNAISSSSSYQLYFATISSNMCKKFHADINDLRMLCTYKGPGTLWLTEDNINQADDSSNDDDSVVIDENRIQQVQTGSVAILKGAIYPKEGTTPIFHRSPTIEERGMRRLLIRIDTNEFGNFN